MVNFMSEDEIRVERGHFDDRCGALLCTSADGLGSKHTHFRIIQLIYPKIIDFESLIFYSIV